MAPNYDWPWQYSFPPFFTLQVNQDTRKKQVEDWCALVLAWTDAQHKSSYTVSDLAQSELFNNSKIQRKLPIDVIRVILDELSNRDNLIWSKDKQSCKIFCRSPKEWASIIWKWVVSSGQQNSVHTVFDLQHEVDVLKNIDEWLLRKALSELESQKKLVFIDEEGVKFLS